MKTQILYAMVAVVASDRSLCDGTETGDASSERASAATYLDL
jgi:hypothetical protein